MYLEEGPGLVGVPLPELEHGQVVEGLGMAIVGAEGEAEALEGQARVAQGQRDVTQVVPHVRWN